MRLLVALACCTAALPAAAITVTRVDVSGLDDELMAENVRVSLALNDAIGKDLSARRLNYLLREAEAETREALEPFGYYSPTIVIQRSDRSVPEGTDDPSTAANARTATADADDGGRTPRPAHSSTLRSARSARVASSMPSSPPSTDFVCSPSSGASASVTRSPSIR